MRKETPRIKRSRKRAMLRGVDAMLAAVERLINPTGRDIMKDISAEMSMRQFASLGRNWELYQLSIPRELDTPKDEYDALFKASGMKFVDLLKRQG